MFKGMSPKTSLSVRVIVCGYVVYLSVTNLYHIITQKAFNQIGPLIISVLLAVAGILLIALSYKVYRKELKAAQKPAPESEEKPAEPQK